MHVYCYIIRLKNCLYVWNDFIEAENIKQHERDCDVMLLCNVYSCSVSRDRAVVSLQYLAIKVLSCKGSWNPTETQTWYVPILPLHNAAAINSLPAPPPSCLLQPDIN